MKHIDVIAFDYYGTLEHIHTSDASHRAWLTLAHFMRCHGAAYEAEQLRSLFERLLEQEAAAMLAAAPAAPAAPEGMPAMLPEPDVCHALRSLYVQCGVNPEDALISITAQVLRAAVTEQLHLYAGTQEMLRALRGAGKRTALLSNAQSAFILPEMQAMGVAGLFDHIFISSQCGVRKPSAAFYQQLIDWAGVPPQRIMMIGNSPEDDIIPARRLGLRTCYIPSALTARGAQRPVCDLYLPRPNMKALTKLLLQAELR